MTAIPHPLSHAGHAAHSHDAGFLKHYVFCTDHKIIGIQFLFLGLAFMVVGGLLAMLIRWDLAWPTPELQALHPVPILSTLLWGQKAADGTITPGMMPPDFFTMAFTMHATIMIFFVIIVLLVGTFGNYLIPLQIGAPDMAFPFLNGVAFWGAVPAGAVMIAGFFLAGGHAAAGWTSYPPLSGLPQNAGTGTAAGNLLQIAHSTWPMAPIDILAFAQFMLAAYICTYCVKLGNTVLNAAVSILISLMFATVMTRRHSAHRFRRPILLVPQPFSARLFQHHGRG